MTTKTKGRDRRRDGATPRTCAPLHFKADDPVLGWYSHGKRARVTRQPHRLGIFRRNRLPDPSAYYAEQGFKLAGRGAWRDAICPFHEDSKPSLRVRLETGAFRCMACGARGGDVLAFHRLRYGLGFVEAAKALGAWEGSR